MNGFFNVLKTPDMTSSDVVVKLRGILRSRTGTRYKVGHLGTLDPGAVGVLPVAVGNATKLFDYLLDKTKVYRACFVFGVATDTLDSYGTVTSRGSEVSDEDAVRRAAQLLVGTYGQVPPAYSAKSVDGVRAYDLARQGVAVALPPRVVTVYAIDLIASHANTFTFDIRCSGGTYVRAIGRDLAAKLGTVAYMSSLIRLQSGGFYIEQSRLLSEIEQDITDGFCSLSDWAKALPAHNIPSSFAVGIRNGVPYTAPDMPSGLFRIMLDENAYGIGCTKEGRLKVVCTL